jgi:23S rRNA G2445 N2-methylase RlmL
MKSGDRKPDKELYRQLRGLPWEQLWFKEVARFDQAPPRERSERVAVIRAVGVVFSETGNMAQKQEVRRWLLNLLRDPCEKARRYAMSALPKIGSAPGDEAELISVLRTTASDREKKFVGRTLEKVGGAATLAIMAAGNADFLPDGGQKVRARLARGQSPSAVRLDSVLADFAGVRINLRGRKGLEGMVRDEVDASARRDGKFRVADAGGGRVGIIPAAPFSLADIYALRCFGNIGFVLGTMPLAKNGEDIEGLAAVIASALSQRLLRTFTEGAVRYRLNFVAKGHQRGAVRLLAARIYNRCPEILNDGREVTWTVDIHPAPGGNSVELRPNLTPDPRFYYRKDDVPAASHPPLAACLARFAGRVEHEIVWDPFCGSGLELIESALLGGVQNFYGTDHNPGAIAIAQANFAAAKVKSIPAKFACCDFRDFTNCQGLGPDSVTLIITNPPMGKRVFAGDLPQLIEDLFSVAAKALKPGGRLVLANPLRPKRPHPLFKLQCSQPVDFGGFECRLEKHVKLST